MSQENRCRKQMLFQNMYSDCFQFDMIGTLNLLMHVRLQFWLWRDHCWPYLVDWIYPFHQLRRSDRKDMIVGLTLVKKTSVDKLLKEEFHVAKLRILCMKGFSIVWDIMESLAMYFFFQTVVPHSWPNESSIYIHGTECYQTLGLGPMRMRIDGTQGWRRRKLMETFVLALFINRSHCIT